MCVREREVSEMRKGEEDVRLWRVCTALCGCVRAGLQARWREWKKEREEE